MGEGMDSRQGPGSHVAVSMEGPGSGQGGHRITLTDTTTPNPRCHFMRIKPNCFSGTLDPLLPPPLRPFSCPPSFPLFPGWLSPFLPPSFLHPFLPLLPPSGCPVAERTLPLTPHPAPPPSGSPRVVCL